MVSIQEATKNAMAFARDALGPERTGGIRLEEVESTTVRGGGAAWLITLSMITPAGQTGSLVEALAGKNKREYKSFTVIKPHGEVRSMKIRELADA